LENNEKFLIWKFLGYVVGGFIALFLVVYLILFVFFMDRVQPSAGEEAVLIHKPRFYGQEGVDPIPVKTGSKYIWTSTEHLMVNTLPIQETIHLDDFNTSDGVPLDFDCLIRFRVTDSVRIIKEFGWNWYQVNLKSEVVNRVRSAVKKHGLNETAIEVRAIDEIDAEVTEAVKQYLESINIPVELIDFTVGRANPPQGVLDQRAATAVQQQKILTEAQRKLAEDAREVAEISRAKADNAYRNNMQLSPEQFLTLETLKTLNHVGGQGSTFIIGVDKISPSIVRK
jgi:regulator of protease activity HflC (stomatin/prohibitin superfamily)